MYEVFLNDRSITLADENESASLDNPEKAERISCRELLTERVNRFLSSEEVSIALTGQIHILWAEFQLMFKLLPAAGGIVHCSRGFLFIYRRGKWDLPKGKTETHETSEEAALREVKEETGISNLTIDKSISSTWHIYRSPYKHSKGEWILKETKWYSMTATGDESLSPETGEDIEEARWFTMEELDDILANTFSSLKKLIQGLQS